MIAVSTVVLACMPIMWRAGRMAFVWLTGYAAFLILMHGGLFGLSTVSSAQWGGLSLTLFV